MTSIPGKAVFIGVMCFAAGVLVRDVAQDWLDVESMKRFAAEVVKCEQAGGVISVSSKGGMVCSPPKWSIGMPIRGKK